MAKLAATLAATGRSVDNVSEALQDFVSMCAAHAEEFWGHRNASNAPSGGWAGRWDAGGQPMIVATVARDWLARMGYDARAMIRSWADAGAIEVDAEQQPSIVAKIDGKPCRVIKMAAQHTSAMQVLHNEDIA
jgi:hypothetical protein